MLGNLKNEANLCPKNSSIEDMSQFASSKTKSLDKRVAHRLLSEPTKPHHLLFVSIERLRIPFTMPNFTLLGESCSPLS